MAEDNVTVNGYARDIETVHKSSKAASESWNGNTEIEKNKTAFTPGSEGPKESQSVSNTAKNEVNADGNQGPDQVLPSNELWTCSAGGRIKIRATDEQLRAEPPISIPGLLHKSANLYPDRVALATKNSDGSWTEVTFKQYEENVRTVAKAFIKLGLQRYSSVAIIGFNSIEWFYSDLAAILAGGFAAGMYTTNGEEACHHCLESSRANICVVEDEKQLQKILAIKSKLPHLKAIIQYTGVPQDPSVLSWEQVMKIGEEESDEKLNSILKTIAVNECSTLVYTSGTEGKSKAVMLSHDNLTWDAGTIVKFFKLSAENYEVIISYLPLSHVAAQVTDIYATLTVGAKVVFADKDALKGTLKNTLSEARPTIFLGVPRVWEKMYEALLSIGKQSSGLKRTLASWAKMASLQHHESSLNGNGSESYRYKFYRWLVFDRIKQRMGLDRCRIFISAAAPIALDIKKYFMSIDILLIEAFGMSECAGAHTAGSYEKFSLGGVGLTLPGAETKLDHKDDQGGEICMRGRHIFMGYLDEPEKTKAALDEGGWLHSGDVGTIDDNGNLLITGRIKELLITAGGENIAPVLIEQTVKSELPVISNAMLIGDKRKFLSILLTLRTEMDKEGRPTDVLVQDVKSWCEKLVDGTCETVSDILNNSEYKTKVYEAIQEGLNRANKKAISRAQNVQKFALLPGDFTVGEELGPTLKIKRPVVYKKYEEIIEGFYKETNTGK